MTTIDTGFFTMDDTNVILTKTLKHAQDYCVDKVDAFVKAHPQTDHDNVLKALKMIHTASSSRRLAIDVSNFILAHPSENLKTL